MFAVAVHNMKNGNHSASGARKSTSRTFWYMAPMSLRLMRNWLRGLRGFSHFGVSLAYTGSHVEGIRRSAEAIGPYRGVGISGCGRYVGRRVPCFGTPAHPRAGGFRFGYADSVGAYARVGFPGIVDRAYVDQSHGWFHHDAATRYRQFPSAGWFRTSGRSVLPGGRTAYRHLLHQSRTRCGAQVDRFRRAFAAYVGRGTCYATQHPEWLLEKNGFNLLGSRSADGRVPSIWMSQNAPRLGAVWPNSRHTWLGNAFCVSRRGVSLFH